MKEREIEKLRMDARIASIYHRAMVSLVVLSSTSTIGSVAITYKEVLPVWAGVAITAGSALIAATSAHQTRITRRWARDAQEAYEAKLTTEEE